MKQVTILLALLAVQVLTTCASRREQQQQQQHQEATLQKNNNNHKRSSLEDTLEVLNRLPRTLFEENNEEESLLEQISIPQAWPLPTSSNGQLRPPNQPILPLSILPTLQQQQNKHHAHHNHQVATPEPETAYACEGNQLDLTCQEGKYIHMLRANYGRFSVNICNDLGFSNLKTDCASFRAFLPMQSRCNNQSNCSVIVSKELFGDPCENTPKYLEVQYYCYDVNNNQQQSGAIPSSQVTTTSGQQQQQQQQKMLVGELSAKQAQDSTSGSTTTPVVRTNNGGHKSQTSAGFDSATNMATSSVGSQTGTSSTNNHNNQAELDTNNQEDLSSRQQQAVIGAHNLHQYCAPQTSTRNLFWNYTRAGMVARQACPEGSSGKASWFCDTERVRFSPAWSPDFTQCRSVWLTRLASQLEQILETPSKPQMSAETTRLQNEQVLKNVLNDLALMAKLKQELFSEDLKRIDIMINQIISQVRSLSALYGSSNSFNNWRTPVSVGASSTGNSFNTLYEDLFQKIVSIISSLFDISQRSAWLDIQPNEYRRKLEQRFLNHLKESGLLLANSAIQSHSIIGSEIPMSQANVFASIIVINEGLTKPWARFSNSLYRDPTTDLSSAISDDNVEYNFHLKQSQLNLNKFMKQPRSTPQHLQEDSKWRNSIDEVSIPTPVIRELLSNGVTKFLVLAVKKPDYMLIKQQLESTYASTLSSSQAEGNLLDNNLIGEQQQWTSKVLGVFGVVGENGDVLDGQQYANTQLQHKLTDLLAQWPISVDFKVLPASGTSNNNLLSPAQTNQAMRQCNSLSDNVNQQQQSRCQTLTLNSTDHICRCDQFGFVSLSSASNQQVPASIFGDFPWSRVFGNGANQNINGEGSYELQQELSANSNNKNVDLLNMAPSYINAQNNKSQQQPLGVWSTIFVVLGISLLVVSLVAIVVNFILKSWSSTGLNKKQAAFLSSTGSSILNQHHRTGGDHMSGTTGPIADHSLIGVGVDPIVVSSAGHNTASMMGLSQPSYHNYKTHQQLYASHLPPIEVCSSQVSGWTKWTSWLKPSRWPFFSVPGKSDQIIEHRVIGSSGMPGSVSYKSQYQNGYTTALHHSHQSTATSQLPLNAPSSSTSSYVSSSAYYEEIGPGNLTKVSTNQLTGNRHNTHTVVDPFKRQASADQQQLLSGNQHHHLQSQHATAWAAQQPTSATTTALSYSLDPQQPQSQLAANYGQPLSTMFKHNNINNDLNQVQSSSSSAGSQHSASTSVTTANGSTPRHYLFASPIAVNAYKSSMSQQTLNHHHQHLQHQQQQQHQLQQPAQYHQQHFKQDHHGKFMQNN